MVADAAAEEWIGFAKKCFNKFHNSKLYKPPAFGVIAMMDSFASQVATEQNGFDGC